MIRKVTIENFRSIKKQTVVLNKLTAIIGKNGSGKSNFISAITLFKSLASGGDLDAIVNSKIAPLTAELFYFKDHQTDTRFEFALTTNNGNNYIFSYHIAHTKIAGTFRIAIQNETLKKVEDGNEIVIYRRDRELAYAGETQNQIPFKVDPTRLMLSSYSDENVIEVTKAISAYTIIIDTILDTKEGLNIVQSNRPNTNTIDGVAVSLLRKNHGRFDSAVKSIQKIIPGFIAPTILTIDDKNLKGADDTTKSQDDEVKNYIVTWKDTAFPDRYSQISLSSGDRRVIHIIFSLFNTEEQSFMVVEEIENGMHYERISKLIDETRTQSINRKVQLLFTTHSNEILKGLTVPEVIYCKKDVDHGTTLIPMSDTKEYETIKNDLRGDHNVADVLQSGLFS